MRLRRGDLVSLYCGPRATGGTVVLNYFVFDGEDQVDAAVRNGVLRGGSTRGLPPEDFPHFVNGGVLVVPHCMKKHGRHAWPGRTVRVEILHASAT